jgi:hypothetical protein
MYKIILTANIYFLICACNNTAHVKPSLTDATESDTINYLNIDSKEIERVNAEIASQSFNSAEEVMLYYMPKEPFPEGNYVYELSKKKISANESEITALTDGLLDDSRKGRKVVMSITHKGNSYKILSIKESYKCYKNRGHEEWGPAFCN